MKKIRKIGTAVVGTALLVGATAIGGAGFAAAQQNNQTNQTNNQTNGNGQMPGNQAGEMDLGDFPQPFVSDSGQVRTSIVVGENSRPVDAVGALNIAGSLGIAAAGDGGGGIVTDTLGWSVTNGVSLDTRNDRLFFLDQLDEVRETITENELEELEEVTFQDDGGDDTDVEFFLYPGNQQVTFGKPDDTDDEDPFLFVDNPADVDANDFLFQLQANFEDDLNFTEEDVIDEEIELFGRTYTVSTDTTDDELVLFGSQQEFDVESGETRTITIDGEEHTFEVVSVTDSDTAAIRVDGTIREEDEDETFTIDDQEIRVSDIIQTNADQSEGIVTFSIGSEELHLQNNQAIEDDDGDDIDGTYVQMNGGSNSNVDELSSLSVYVGAEDDDQEFVEAGSAYNHPLFENYEFHFGGLNPDASAQGSDAGEYSYSTSGDDAVTADFTGDRGDDANIEFAFAPDPDNNANIELADSDGDMIKPREGANVTEDEYFLSDAGDFAHMYEVTGMDVDDQNPSSGDEAVVDLQDVVTGNNVEVDLDASGSIYEGSEVIDGQTYRFTLNTQGSGTEDDVIRPYWGDGSTFTSPGDEIGFYPALDTDSGASLTFTKELNYSQADTSSQIYELPSTETTDQVEVNISVDYGAANAIDAQAVSGITVVEDGSDTDAIVRVNGGGEYIFTADTANNVVDVSPYDGNNAVTDPASVIIEPENDDDDEEVYWEVPSVDSGDNEIQVNSPIYTGPRRTSTLESNDDITAGFDVYGTYTEFDSDAQREFDLSVPFSQSTAGAAITGVNGDLTASDGGNRTVSPGNGGTPAQWPNSAALDTDGNIGQLKQNRNLILVGGPVVNSLVQELAQQNMTQPASEYQQGQALIQLIEGAYVEENAALVVAGHSGDDTRAAANFISNYEDNQDELSGRDRLILNTGGN